MFPGIKCHYSKAGLSKARKYFFTVLSTSKRQMFDVGLKMVLLSVSKTETGEDKLSSTVSRQKQLSA